MARRATVRYNRCVDGVNKEYPPDLRRGTAVFGRLFSSRWPAARDRPHLQVSALKSSIRYVYRRRAKVTGRQLTD